MKLIEGYKSIAALLSDEWQRDVSVDSAWRLVHSEYAPLPVVAQRPRVLANESVVVAWARKQPLWRRGRR